MRKTVGIVALALAACGIADAAYAGMSDEECAEHVAQQCGPMSLDQCFKDDSMWNKIDQDCTAYVQTNIENAREATEQDTQQNTTYSAVGMDGYSYGGQLRMGPGMEFAKQASVTQGEPIKVLADTGVWMDGYKWFKVRTSQGTGYHWGGIFCIPGDVPAEGVLDNCEMLNQ